MVATNYRMKERTRRPMRREEEEEDKEEEKEEEVVGGEEVESAVTMEGRVLLEGVTKLPRGVVEV